ncbi:hypothetical protein E5082_15640 [Streptomyces griseoluteus]|uniref:Lactococcin 972 family bacteriocin n=1 Tax=Streptomyces griseoluteus TaxID=29306 RepID=A0A4Z1DHA5_STRGP|nr:lactococcin 972 family bacteriocin [Streptomyces griseoluteus]TGN83028.1 hypothetical protein E5082_15640 [Streptomyces griseoluteus]GHF17389.1 hypothetical protein GCM10017776_38880 [Streptomyces griseoluteus]
MKKFGKSIVFGFVSAALAVCSFSTPAVASGSQGDTAAGKAGTEATAGLTVGQPVIHKRGDGVNPPAELGNPSEWGVVKIELTNSAVQPLANTCKTVTHGKWCYGYELNSDGKKCYSNYIANVKHKSTVRADNIDYGSGWVAKGDTSYAHVTVAPVTTCYSYYDNA